MKTKFAVLFVVLAVILAACGQLPPGVSSAIAAPATAAPAMQAYANQSGAPAGGTHALRERLDQAAASDAVAQARLVATSVDLSIVVADPQKKERCIYQMA